jgi:hypothetical protein
VGSTRRRAFAQRIRPKPILGEGRIESDRNRRNYWASPE